MASANGTHYAITGIQEGTTGDKNDVLRKVPIRMEIDEWFHSTDLVHINQRALFFPAFWKFSQMPPQEKTSWFQVAGIHGKPYIAWDEPIQYPTKGAAFEGYCTHNSILFSTWHRPYMMLWEQVIYELMLEEVKQYPADEQAELIQAAESWRFPYWDWALKKTLTDSKIPFTRNYTVPAVCKVENKQVQIRQPTGQGFGKVNNAFYQFTMPGGIAMGDESLDTGDSRTSLAITPGEDGLPIPFNKCKGTSRQPPSSTKAEAWAEGNQNNSQIETILRDYNYKGQQGPGGHTTSSLRDAFYRVLMIPKFNDFATKRDFNGSGRRPMFQSAEGLHDFIHGVCGGGTESDDGTTYYIGHMGEQEVAAFDPIFWLHHCNIDRLVAIWQVLHDDGWFEQEPTDPRYRDNGNFYMEGGHLDKPTDALRPFHYDSQDGHIYTSNDVRNVTALGYTYGGLEKWEYTTDGVYDNEKHKIALMKSLNDNYNAAEKAAQKSFLTGTPGTASEVPLAPIPQLIEETGQELQDLTVDDYTIDVVYSRYDLKGQRYTISFFVGGVPDSPPYELTGEHSIVGQVFNFSSALPADADAPGCGNCRKQEKIDALSTGQVALTDALITRWKNGIEYAHPDPSAPKKLEGMEPEKVVEFLKHHLHWRVTSRGQPIDISQVPSLKIAVAVGKADHFKDQAKLSRFYGYQGAYEVTSGRPGGATEADAWYPVQA